MGSDIEQVRQQLLELVQDGKTEDSLNAAQSALQTYPDDAEVTMLAGLAYDQAGKIDEATTLLRRATVLAPTDPETFHNLAVSLYNQGDFVEAEQYAEEALKLDPEHEKALETLRNCQAQKGEVSFKAEDSKIEPTEETVRSGLDDKPNYVWNLGVPWTRVGFGLVFYCLASFLFIIFCPFMNANQQIRHDPMSIVAFFLYVTSGLACGIWMLIDIIDRREKFAWLLPMWVCGLMAIPVLPLALYLAVGRKVVQMA